MLVSVEALLAESAEKMAGVVDAGFRAQLTGEYLALLKAWHSTPSREKAMRAAEFGGRAKDLARKVSAGLVQYKLEPGLGDMQDKVRDSLSDARDSMMRLEKLAARQNVLATRQTWEFRLKRLAEILSRVRSEMQFASAQVNLSRLDALASTVNNLLAVEMLPLELEWSAALKVAPPKFMPGASADSGALSLLTSRGLWTRTLGDAAEDDLAAYQQAVTDAWDTSVEDVENRAGAAWGKFQDIVKRLAALKVKHSEQAVVAGKLEAAGDEAAPALRGDLSKRELQLSGLITEVRNLAESMKKTSFDLFDEPGQLVRTQLGSDLGREKAAVALFYSPQIEDLLGKIPALESGAQEFDARSGARATAGNVTAIGVAAGLGLIALLAFGRKGR
jgi:hypothetical protein